MSSPMFQKPGKKYEGKEIKNSADLTEYLLEKSLIAVVPGSGFGLEGFIRISYATSMSNIEKGMDRLEKGLKALN